ncbi:MAG: HD domain-containing protein [Bacteroidota bacterium]
MMNINYHALEESAGRFVTRLYTTDLRVEFPYHNLRHTVAVVEHVKEIAAFYKLGDHENCMLILAAWFHDTGQLSGDCQGHEQRSVVILHNYLSSAGLPGDIILAAEVCVMATKGETLPVTLSEKIICDADTYHFGTALFRQTEFLVQKEMEMRTGQQFPKWHQGSLQLLQNHVFYTAYCQLKLNAGKKENIRWLESLV